MIHLKVSCRAWVRPIAAACAVLGSGLLWSAPASASVVPASSSALHKETRAPLVEHMGTVNPLGRREFTVLVKSGSHADAVTIAGYLQRFGLATTIAPGDRSIHVQGTIGQTESAAGVRFERLKAGAEIYVRTTGPALFPPAIARLVAGTSINPGVKARAQRIISRALVVGPQTGYGPGDFASVYGITAAYGSGITGKGSTVAIAACFNIDRADIAFFASAYGLPTPKVHIIHIDGTRDQFGDVPPPDIEPTQDVERVIGTAPDATVDLYLVPDCLISQFVDMFAAIASDAHATAMSVSYGLPEGDYAFFGLSDLLVAQSAALQNVADGRIAIFAASGDGGSWGDPAVAVNFLDVLYPASDPNVISVGGTTLEETLIRTRMFEYAWGGSGGGFSGIFTIPPWQARTPGVASGLTKNVPDVSLDGDPNTGAATAFLVSLPPPIFPVGGTSVSSPTWAGIWALVDQARRNNGHARFAKPAAALYSLRGSSAYNDVTVGTNGYFAARAGYDNATGLGVPNVSNLVKALQ